jgi:hypothetical protein
MGCHKKTFNRIMANVRRRHPNYSLQRRKNIVNAAIYGKKR